MPDVPDPVTTIDPLLVPATDPRPEIRGAVFQHIPLFKSTLLGPKYQRDFRTGEYEVAEDYLCTMDDGICIKIQAGTRTDNASSPRPAWAIVAPTDLGDLAPLVHDLLYRNGGVLPRCCVTPYRTWTRAEADGLFKILMKREGVSALRWRTAYAAVRAFGAVAWRGR